MSKVYDIGFQSSGVRKSEFVSTTQFLYLFIH